MRNEQSVVEIRSPRLQARITPKGAELAAIVDAEGRDLLWSGDPAFWSFRAPLLFPIVGMLNDGRYRAGGRSFTLEKHGFARRSLFSVVEQSADAARFRLEADAETLKVYPFLFRLDLVYAVDGARLTMTATITNMDKVRLPASFGFHPAFAWPLPSGGARSAHRVVFAEPEPAPIRRIDAAGLVRPAPLPTPVAGRTLTLADDLFVDDALIFDALASRSLDYVGEGGAGLRVGFEGLPLLGIWTKPGAPFVCIEPWSGLADPEGFGGDIFDKPYMLAFEPGEARSFVMTVETIGGPLD